LRKGKIVIGLFTLLLVSMLAFTFNVQTVKASSQTIYIRADGSIDPPTAPISSVDNVTYTFTADIYDSIVVERDDIVVDGTGYTVQGTGALYSEGIELSFRNNVTLKNVEVTNFDRGISLYSSHHNTLSGNNASNNTYGIRLWVSSNNVLVGNTASNNQYNFEVSGRDFSHFNNYVDTSNTVDGKPIYYLIGVADAIIDAGTNAGTIYIINSNNITIRDLTLTKNYHGAFFWNTTNSKILNVTASNNAWYGIHLDSSSNNVLTGNTASNNDDGIRLWDSSNNVLTGNTASNNAGYGIHLDSSSNNVLTGNTASNNAGYGIFLKGSSNNVLTGNTASNNDHGIYLWYSSNNNVIYSSNNTLSGNNASNNTYGIRLWDSHHNTLSGNNASNNKHGIYLSSSSNNVLTGNTASNNIYGISLFSIRSHNNTLTGNTASNNDDGIYLKDTYNNVLFHNNLINNTAQARVTTFLVGYVNTWNDGYPSGGNYWSDHVCTGNPSNGSQPYVIDADNIDHYPFQYPSGWLLDTASPVADAGSDQTVNEDVLATLDGSGSTDNVGVTSYIWTFLDVTQKTLTGVNPTYTFETVGGYTVTLDVADAAGNHATDTVVITVLDVTDPVADAGSDQTVEVGETVSFNADDSTDNVGITSYEWDFGDGTTGSGVTSTHTYDKSGTYTITITLEDAAGNVGTDSVSVSVEKKGCIIATATFGSELAPEVQFLRGFRDNTVLNTFAGSSFMTVFNAWYYSFSPEVASVIAADNALRGIMKILLYPLIGILHITATIYSLFSLYHELAIVVSGLVASSLIGIIYLSPLAMIIRVIKKVKIHPRTLRAGSMIWGLSIGGIATAEITRWSAVMMFSTAVFVIITMILATLTSVKYVARYIQH